MGFVYTGEMVDLGGGRGWLNRYAANSLFRLDRRVGHKWQITEAGRTWDQQNAHYQNYLRNGYPIALSPDAPSLHQRGNAIDTDERTTWLLNEYGWQQTVYRWVNGVWTLVEPWHYEYFLENDQHRNEPAGGEEEDMTPEQDAMLKNIAAHLYLGGPSASDPMYTGGAGTVYEALKVPVWRSSLAKGTALPPDAATIAISQIQDNADTNSLVRQILPLVNAIAEKLGLEGIEEPEPPKA